WPGNLRELQSALKQALLHATGPKLLPDFLPAYLRSGLRAFGTPTAAPLSEWDQFINERLQAGSKELHAEWTALTERYLLRRVLRHTNGNQVQGAKILGISRNSLRSKLRTLGITIERSVAADEES